MNYTTLELERREIMDAVLADERSTIADAARRAACAHLLRHLTGFRHDVPVDTGGIWYRRNPSIATVARKRTKLLDS